MGSLKFHLQEKNKINSSHIFKQTTIMKCRAINNTIVNSIVSISVTHAKVNIDAINNNSCAMYLQIGFVWEMK
jgi:hypothetical protein